MIIVAKYKERRGGGGCFFFFLCFFFGIQVRETFSFGSLLSSASGQMLSSNSSSTSCFPWPLVCMCERIARMSLCSIVEFFEAIKLL